MEKKKFILLLFILATIVAHAENWDYIRESGEYYYGIGMSEDYAEAESQALADLSSMIAVNVSSDFRQLDDLTGTNGAVDHQTRVLNCIKTYTYSALKDVGRYDEKQGKMQVVRRYIRKSDLGKIYEGRIQTALSLVNMAEQSLERRYIDQALKYYYWAYSLVRSLQYPENAKDAQGVQLSTMIPAKIEWILKDITVRYVDAEDDRVNLAFLYQGEPVSTLVYSFNNGRDIESDNRAKDGRGCLYMAPGCNPETYHIDIEYQFIDSSKGDKELESVLCVIPPRSFSDAHKVVGMNLANMPEPEMAKGKESKDKETGRPVNEIQASSDGLDLAISESQKTEDFSESFDVMSQVIDALRSKSSLRMTSLCTSEALCNYSALIGYGMGKIIGEPKLYYYKGLNGNTVVRGLQMSFLVGKGSRKRTFVEDVVFTINTDHKICNISFGLGKEASNDILDHQATGWQDYTREMLMEFLETFRTAYCLEDIDYINAVFSDDAVIIIGNVLIRKANSTQDMPVTDLGRETIKYNRLTKDQYISNLERVFGQNDFINIRFGNNEVQWLEKYSDKEIFAINIRQEYSSSTYSDKGYLFLIVDMTDHDAPEIRVRTWQPNEVPISEIYHAGYFYGN